MEKYCYFWLNKGNKAFLSQWYDSEFKVDGVTYSNAEQYMMAQKALTFNDKIIYNKILHTIDPKEIKALGRKVKNFNESVWDSEKRDVVYKGTYAKFSQNEDLKKKLIATGDDILVEASPYDTIWGIGLKESDPLARKRETWKGQNLLGDILVEVREKLK